MKVRLFLLSAFIFTASAACRPEIVSTSPADGDSDTKGHSEIIASVSTGIDPSTLQFTLESGGDRVPGSVSVEKGQASGNDEIVFRPEAGSRLISGRTYTATIRAGLSDTEGSPMKDDFSWSFSIETVPPVLESISPENGQMPAEGQPEIILRFNEAVGEISYSLSPEHSVPFFSDDRKKVSIRLNNLRAGASFSFILYGFSDTAGNYAEINRVTNFRALRP